MIRNITRAVKGNAGFRFLGAKASNLAVKAFSTRRVTIEQAKDMAKNYDEMSNDILLTMACMGDQDAREERLIREIMAVDNLSW